MLLAGPLSADLGVPGGALAAELEQLDDHALVEGGTDAERGLRAGWAFIIDGVDGY